MLTDQERQECDDIDENGELKSYNPDDTSDGNVLLRITMNDSSEREYKVTQTVADDFIAWCNRNWQLVLCV